MYVWYYVAAYSNSTIDVHKRIQKILPKNNMDTAENIVLTRKLVIGK